jgi:biopolymer transport protein TolR
MAFYYSRRKLKPREDGELGELNIVPYLDILMNLILFMLLSITGLASFGILNVSAPSYGAPSTAVQPDNGDQPRLILSVLISKQGLFIRSANGLIGESGGGPTISLKADGSYDYEALSAKMQEIKQAFPTETQVIIAADADVQYEALIATMDACRETPGKDHHPLFPDVTLGAL